MRDREGHAKFKPVRNRNFTTSDKRAISYRIAADRKSIYEYAMAGETDGETDKGTTIIKSIFYIWSVTASRRTGCHWDAWRTHKYGRTHTDTHTRRQHSTGS